jgi:hypothetical protein
VTDLQPASVRQAVAAAPPARSATYARARPILAQFSASNGGWTVGDPRLAYLPAKADPYDRTHNPYATWTASLSVARLAQCFPAAGTVQRITVLRRDGHGEWGGRMLSVRLTGRTRPVRTGDPGRDRVLAAVLRRDADRVRDRHVGPAADRDAGRDPQPRRRSSTCSPAGRPATCSTGGTCPAPAGRPGSRTGARSPARPTVERDADGSLVLWARGGAKPAVRRGVEGGCLARLDLVRRLDQQPPVAGGAARRQPVRDGAGVGRAAAVRELDRGRRVHRLAQPRRRCSTRPGRR